MTGDSPDHVVDPGLGGRNVPLTEYLRDLVRRLGRDVAAARGGALVPPIDLGRRLNGGRNPSIAEYYADVVVHPPLPSDGHVLDMGCGYGRVALALTTRLTADQRYLGLDPHAEAVEWGRANIGAAHPQFTFEHVDLDNGAYNPGGAVRPTDFRFPFADGSLDVVLMISVTTHVDLETVQHYVREAARTLDPTTGRLVATFFLLDPHVDELLAQGRSSFRMGYRHGPSRVEDPDRPELAIAHPRERVLEMLHDAGFAATTVVEGDWCGRSGTGPHDYQDLVIAHRGPRPPQARTDEPAVRVDSPGPDEGERAALADGVLRLARVGVTGVSTARALIDWATAAVLNTLWWQDRGWTLAAASGGDAAGGDPVTLVFTHCRALGFDARAPRGVVGLPQVSEVDEQVVLDLLVGAGAAATPRSVLDAVVEIICNAVELHRVVAAGQHLVLRTPTGDTVPAPLPLRGPLPRLG